MRTISARSEARTPVGKQPEEVSDADLAVGVEVSGALLGWIGAIPPGSQQRKEVRDADSAVTIEVAKAARVQSYLAAGHSGNRLLNELGRLIIWNDTGVQLLPTLRSVFEEWENCEGSDPALGAGHPSRGQLLVGLARFATDIRTKKESGSSTTMAMRFAEGRTTVDAFDD